MSNEGFSADSFKEDLKKRMSSTHEAFVHDLKGLRTGRVSPQLLDTIMVEAYGGKSPLPQVGTVNVLEARLLGVQVWDSGLVTAVEKAIRQSNLGLNPFVDGNTVRIPIPDLTEERRKELIKLASQYAEKARVGIRGVRREGMERLKKEENDASLSEDEAKRLSQNVQKMTDEAIAKIEDSLDKKKEDILKI